MYFMENYEYSLLFGNEPVAESEKARVMEEVQKLGGLSFIVSQGEDGWSAQCSELPALIVGGTNSNPTSPEIEAEIRSAIFAVFDVKIEPRDTPSLNQRFQYAIKKQMVAAG